MHHEDPITAIHSTIAPEPGDIIVRKTRIGAFSTTDLDAQLRARDIDTVVLAGFSSLGVVLTTHTEAADRDYHVYILKDATADHDPEVHRMLTEKVFPFRSHVITTEELQGILDTEPQQGKHLELVGGWRPARIVWRGRGRRVSDTAHLGARRSQMRRFG